MKRVFSAMQPTGLLHIGNWLGALKQWVKLQEKYNCLFCIVDYHAMTIPFEPKKMPENILNLALDYLSAGIDPKKSIVFVQSHVPQHTELAWILNTITPIGELSRMTQFKEKSKEHPESINMGLFDYPVLMAADILLYKTEIVPVGEDQLQHVELARTLVRKFNTIFGQTLAEPKALLTKTARIMSLTDPTKKMSKSYDPESYIALSDSPEMIWKKLSTAVTDPARIKKIDPGNPEKCNLFSLHQAFSSQKEIDFVANGCQKALIGCLECKKILAKNISKELQSFQKKQKELQKNPEKIKKILLQGALQASKIARQTIREVKTKLGLLIK